MTEANVPPQNGDAEAAVLGACLMTPTAIDASSDILRPDDFYNLSHGRLFTEILRMHAAGLTVDALTLSAALPDDKVMVYDLAKSALSSANVGHYARIVKETATFRGLIRAGGEIARLGWERKEDGRGQAEQIIYDLNGATSGEAVPFADVVSAVYDELVALDGKSRELLGAPSGLPALDQVTRGFRNGDLIVVAADTGRGKSALSLNISLHLAVQKNLPVAFFSLEMSENELVGRAISLVSGISHDRLTRGEIRKDEWDELALAVRLLQKAPIYLRTDASIKPAGIRSELRRWKTRNPDGALAVVDYLQLVTPDDKSDNRTVDVSGISRALKVTAMSLGIPVLAVSQLRRRLPNTKPHRNDLRESGAIENDASVVVLIHHPEDRPGVAELLVAKTRHGAERDVAVAWIGERMHFKPLGAAAVSSEARAA